MTISHTCSGCWGTGEARLEDVMFGIKVCGHCHGAKYCSCSDCMKPVRREAERQQQEAIAQAKREAERKTASSQPARSASTGNGGTFWAYVIGFAALFGAVIAAAIHRQVAVVLIITAVTMLILDRAKPGWSASGAWSPGSVKRKTVNLMGVFAALGLVTTVILGLVFDPPGMMGSLLLIPGGLIVGLGVFLGVRRLRRG